MEVGDPGVTWREALGVFMCSWSAAVLHAPYLRAPRRTLELKLFCQILECVNKLSDSPRMSLTLL